MPVPCSAYADTDNNSRDINNNIFLKLIRSPFIILMYNFFEIHRVIKIRAVFPRMTFKAYFLRYAPHGPGKVFHMFPVQTVAFLTLNICQLRCCLKSEKSAFFSKTHGMTCDTLRII